MREFVLLARRAVTRPFRLNDLPSSAGRMDLVCRCISNALFISEAIRKDVIIHVILGGPDRPPRLITFDGSTLRNVSPDERNIASHIRIALERGMNLKLNESINVSPGIKIAKRSFENLVKEKAKTTQLIYLHPRGTDIKNFNFDENICVILGDHLGIPKNTEKLLKRLNVEKVSVGKTTYLAS
jgi:tRNA (pseudouridine54-N1)-methyltransferase